MRSLSLLILTGEAVVKHVARNPRYYSMYFDGTVVFSTIGEAVTKYFRFRV